MRILFLLFSATIIFANASGQATIGISAGFIKVLNHKAIKETDYHDEKFPIGYTGGLSYLLNNEKRLSFFAKAGFTQKGFLRQSGIPDQMYFTKVRINYLYLSPQASIKILNSNKRNLFFSIGPYIGLTVGGKETGTWITLSGPRDYNERIVITNSPKDNTDAAQIATTDLGINSSLSYQLNNYGVMLTWQKGLKNIISNLPFSSSEMIYRNNTLELSLSYQFNLSGLKKGRSGIKCPTMSPAKSKKPD